MQKTLSALALGVFSLLLLLLAVPAAAAPQSPGSAPIDRLVAATTAITATDPFTSPFGPISTTSDYEVQWNIIISDTRYGVRNLSLPNEFRRCWGVAWNRNLHAAIDLYRGDGADATGTPVYAIADGEVAYYNPAYTSYPGRVVILSHLLEDGRTLYAMYGHLATVSVTQGAIVTSGQPIGTIVSQGDDSHLHFELRWFLNASAIYPATTSCNGLIYGRGYTYLTYPDDFPAPGNGYLDPDAFIQAHGGPSLTPIGAPDSREPITLTAASADLRLSTDSSVLPNNRSVLPTTSGTGIGGPGLLVTPTQKIAPQVAAIVAQTETLTYTAYLPLVVNGLPLPPPPPPPDSCVEGQNLLTNGGFEDGPGSAPWMQLRNTTSDLIDDVQAYSSTYSLWLAGRNLADEEALQAGFIPTDTVGLTLTFKRLLTSQEYEAKVYDHFELVLENQVGNEVSPQLSITNLSPNRNVWITETAAFSGLEPWQNRWLRLSLKGMTDSNLLTSLYLDDVELQMQCAP